MKLLIVTLISCVLLGQTTATKRKQVLVTGGSPPPLTITMVAEVTGVDDTPDLTFPTTTCTGTGCIGSDMNLAAHDLVWVTLKLDGGCYSSPVASTLTYVSNGTALTAVAAMTSNGYWGAPCIRSFWIDAPTVQLTSLLATLDVTSWNYGRIKAIVFRASPVPTSWSLVAHKEINGGNTATIPWTGSTPGVAGSSLGSALTNDVLIASTYIDISHASAMTVGTCALSASCTLAANTSDTSGMIEYQLLSGAASGVTPYAGTTGGATFGGMMMNSAIFRVVP